MAALHAHCEVVPIAVTTSGQARHYRIQIRESQQRSWQRFASFPDAEQADECLRELKTSGQQARLVSFCIAPAAA